MAERTTNSRDVMVVKTTGQMKDLIEKMRPEFERVLPKHINPDRILRIATSAVIRTPKLMQCKVNTVMLAILQASILGLEPSTPLGEGWLIPFKDDCQFIPGYRGLLKLARQSGEVASISAYPVYKNEEFDVSYGLKPNIIHKPILDGDRGQLRLVYAIGILKDKMALPYVTVLSLAEIEKIRDNSQGWRAFKAGLIKSSPWQPETAGGSFEQMAIKTAYRRICKTMPASIALTGAIELDERASAGMSQVDLADESLLKLLEIDPPAPENEEETPAAPVVQQGTSSYQGYDKKPNGDDKPQGESPTLL